MCYTSGESEQEGERYCWMLDVVLVLVLRRWAGEPMVGTNKNLGFLAGKYKALAVAGRDGTAARAEGDCFDDGVNGVVI